MGRMEKLWLSNNALTFCSESLPSGSFQGLTLLQELTLHSEITQSCPTYPIGVLRDVPNLRVLSIKVNQAGTLDTIGDDLSNLPKLETLEFRDSEFNRINNDSMTSLRNSSVSAVMFTNAYILEFIEPASFRDIPNLKTISVIDSAGTLRLETLIKALEDTGTSPLNSLAIDMYKFGRNGCL